tara:strand:- start:45 stop:371 length:327 start_codon:yes stop_codon:yes gene_type:complete
MELGQPDKINELQTKLLGDKLKLKKLKDPNLPKRAKSAFMFYCDEHRGKLIDKCKKKGKKVAISEIAKQLGAGWKKLKDRSKFEKSAAKDKERYAEAMSDYNEKNGLN